MVSYTPLGQKVVNQYLIRSITTDLTHDGTQTYNLVRWYPYYIQYVPATSEVLVRVYTDDKSTGNTTGAVRGNVDLVLSITKGQDVSIASNANSSAAKPAEYSGSLTDIYADLWAKIPRFSGGNLTLAKISSNAVQIGSSPISASNAPMKSTGAAKADDGIVGNADVGVISGDNSKANAIELMPMIANTKIPIKPVGDSKSTQSIQIVGSAGIVAHEANTANDDAVNAEIVAVMGIAPTVATPTVLSASSVVSELADMGISANALSQYPRFKQVGDTVYIYRPMRWRQDGDAVYIDYAE